MPAAPRTETLALAAAIALGCLLSYTFSVTITDSVAGLAPMLFGVPLAGVLLWLGHVRWFGALYTAAAIAAGYFIAVYASIAAFSALKIPLCVFGCDAAQIAHGRTGNQVVGAVGGLVGSLLPFLLLMPLGPALRDRKALAIIAITVPMLALFGAIGFSSSIPGTGINLLTPETPNTIRSLLFVVPWQLAFGAALAMLLARHTPRGRQGAVASAA